MQPLGTRQRHRQSQTGGSSHIAITEQDCSDSARTGEAEIIVVLWSPWER